MPYGRHINTKGSENDMVTVLSTALARVAQAEQPWGFIRRDGLPGRLDAHWEDGL